MSVASQRDVKPVRRSEMPDEYENVEFTMVDGRRFTVKRTAGRGREYLNESFEQNWITIDENTRIRTDKVISITLLNGD
jgi:hypothetical protein